MNSNIRTRALRIFSSAAILLMLVALPGCKPTENNYKAAYDAAKNKREKKDADSDILYSGHKLLQDDGSRNVTSSEGTVKVETMALRVAKADSVAASAGRYRLAVGCYKMSTNANGQVEALQGKGYKAYVGSGGTEKWYSIVATCATQEEAVEAAGEFRKKHKDYPYVGLEGPTVIVGNAIIAKE